MRDRVREWSYLVRDKSDGLESIMGRSSILRRGAALVMSICIMIGLSLPANASNISTLSIDSLTSEQKDAITGIGKD